MKKIIPLLLVFSSTLFASPKEELNERLAKTEGFSASFAQKVISPDNELIMEGEGKVEIARPSLFRWTTITPDENVLISDGKTLWYYNPFLEQVSIYWQEQATAKTPFVLLTRNRASDWDNYQITQDGDSFTLTPTAVDATQGEFQININTQGQIQGFNVIEQDGQRGEFVFSNISNEIPNKASFSFIPPEGVEVDDQRN